MVLLQKPSTAVEYLAAHLSKIHGLDWHPDSEHILATSSQDNSVKVSGAPGAGWGACVGGIRGPRAFPLKGKLPPVSMACVSGARVLLGELGWSAGDVDQWRDVAARVGLGACVCLEVFFLFVKGSQRQKHLGRTRSLLSKMWPGSPISEGLAHQNNTTDTQVKEKNSHRH